MTRITLFVIAILFSHHIYSQTSPLDPVCTFNYQAVARSADDNVIANQAVTIQFTILDGPGANELYIEEHATTTSSLGLINLEVGAGTKTGGSLAFEAIPWIIRKHFLKVDMDMDGSGFINLGEAPILAVPIAISAKVAGTSVTTLDTIKRIDTLRVDTLRVKKIFADAICVDSIKGKVIIDTIVTESICLNGDAVIKNGDLTMKDKDGNIIFSVDKNGKSYHGGFETFAGGLEVLGSDSIPIMTIDSIFGLSFEGSTFTDGNVNILDGHLEMVNADFETIFSIDKNGNSYHRGFETFDGGMEVLGFDGIPIFTADPLDDFYFGVSTHTDGNVEIFDGNLEMLNANNEVVFSVDKNGNSYHKGLETFEGGIVLANPDNNETIVFLDATADGLTGYALTVNGNFMLNGLLQAEAKNFLIDHPLNPEEMTLRHYSVESDQMATVYNGTVDFDENGEATVELPRWFEALNTNFSYQLTCIGGFSNVFIAEEVNNNQFKIGGGKEGMKVSWQVNAVRHDPVSSKHIKPIEEYKSTEVK